MSSSSSPGQKVKAEQAISKNIFIKCHKELIKRLIS